MLWVRNKKTITKFTLIDFLDSPYMYCRVKTRATVATVRLYDTIIVYLLSASFFGPSGIRNPGSKQSEVKSSGVRPRAILGYRIIASGWDPLMIYFPPPPHVTSAVTLSQSRALAVFLIFKSNIIRH